MRYLHHSIPIEVVIKKAEEITAIVHKARNIIYVRQNYERPSMLFFVDLKPQQNKMTFLTMTI